jgi:hypothetical protein
LPHYKKSVTLNNLEGVAKPRLKKWGTLTNLEREGEGVWEKAVSFNQDTSSDGKPYSSYNRSRR